MAHMQNASNGGIELGLSTRSDQGGPAFPATLDAKQLLYFLLLIPAGVISLMPLGVYPPLDTRLPMGLIICCFLLSAVPRLWSIARRRPGNDSNLWQAVSTCAGLALPFLGLLLFLNGRLDRSPRSEMRATVIRKTAPIGYREAQYHLKVTSWRPGRSFEDLNVNSREFAGAVVGRPVVVEMHEGYFGLPWYSNISPE
ncbi:MAG TPA: hypothetical protein VNM68_13130 [Candidatus Polarisedimenticolia bacterium]|nr:hypothetical protein [Candidatus Polarisedimenticolia bacterium]